MKQLKIVKTAKVIAYIVKEIVQIIVYNVINKNPIYL